MKENKGVWIAIGCVGVVCLCLAAAFVTAGGFYVYEQVVATDVVTFPTAVATLQPIEPIPNDPPQRQSPEKPTLDDLARISVIPGTYASSTGGEAEGIAIDLIYFDANDEVILFEDQPIDVTLELYAFRDILSLSDLSTGDKLYENVLTLDHSSRMDEMFDNYIRIPYADFDVDPDTYIRFGAVKVTVDAPSGVFEGISTLVILYPEAE